MYENRQLSIIHLRSSLPGKMFNCLLMCRLKVLVEILSSPEMCSLLIQRFKFLPLPT